MIIALLTGLALLAGTPNDAKLRSLIEAKDQALLDAFAPGDRAVWSEALAPDAVYVDENGVIMDRAAFLQNLTPLPKGASGEIKIRDFSFTRHGDLITVIHTDVEHELYHGQKIGLTSLTTETWRLEGGEWKLALAHAYVMLRDPPDSPTTVQQLQGYVGRYAGGPNFNYVITLAGDHLMGGVEGRAPKPMAVESGDVLFIPGQPRTRKIFQRDAAGQVTGFLDRREGEDVVWKRIRPG